MPLDRVPGEQFDVLVDHADGLAGHPSSRGPAPSSVISSEGLSCRPQDARAARRPSVPHLNVGDLVELHPGTGWLGTVLDVVESRPRWLLVYWHTPPNICVNPLLENEEFLTLAVENARRDADAGGADPIVPLLTNRLNLPRRETARRRRAEMEAAMSQQENLRIIREAFAAWNAHDVDRYAALLDEGYVEETHTRPTPVRGREAARAAMREYLRVLPDLHFDLDVMITSGDQVFTRWLATGTYWGESKNRPPSGRQLEEYGCTLSKLGEGGIIHVWHYWETDHFLQHVAEQ